jgi:integrase/recombinase XerD
MKVEDYFVQRRRGWVRLHEKGGKEHAMPTHHNLDRYLDEYIQAAGIAEDRKGPLFRTTRGRSGELTGNALLQSDVWRMIRRRARQWDQDRDRLPHLPRHWYHRLPQERWPA